jgi:hypothetical protein
MERLRVIPTSVHGVIDYIVGIGLLLARISSALIIGVTQPC